MIEVLSKLEMVCNEQEDIEPRHALLGENGLYKCHDARDCPYKTTLDCKNYCSYLNRSI